MSVEVLRIGYTAKLSKLTYLLFKFKDLRYMNSTETMADLSSYTPMMQQYFKVKLEHQHPSLQFKS
ncbi:hypothetical protein BSN82_14935, partial [Acinetobacter baylyi]|uniref:hypothetical protein n=1 Tax=Acinetobacter baylyi TaxID=202950 RepID=UPI001C09092D